MSSPTLKQLTLRSYRHILKSILFTFKNDNLRIINMFQTTKLYYIKYKNINENEIKYMIEQAEDAANFLRTNIVQGVYDKSNGKVQVQAREVSNENIEISPITKKMTEEFDSIKHPLL